MSISIKDEIVSIAKAEAAFFIALFLFRVKIVYSLWSLDALIRRQMSDFDYENGWGFYFIIIGLLACFLTIQGKLRWTSWNLKMTSLICIMFHFGFEYISVAIPCILILLFYYSPRIRPLYFHALSDYTFYKVMYLPVSALLLYLSTEYGFLIY